MKKLLISFLCLLFALPSAEAQFLKNLKRKVQEKVENAATENISEKAAAETEKSLNSMWEMNASQLSVPMGMERVDPALIPDTYDFDWVYNMQMETPEGPMDMRYHLKEDAPYFGIQMPQNPQLFMVMDNEREMILMFMDSEGNKMLTGTKLPADSPSEEATEDPLDKVAITKTDTKEILGYTCQGYQTETEEHIIDFYVTEEAGISFLDMYKANKKQAPAGFDTSWLEEGNGLMMYMEFKDKKDPSKNMKIRCTSLEKKDFEIGKAAYQVF